MYNRLKTLGLHGFVHWSRLIVLLVAIHHTYIGHVVRSTVASGVFRSCAGTV